MASNARTLAHHSAILAPSIFGSFCILGIAFILWSKWIGFSQLWVTAGPVLIMLIYSILLFSSRFLRLRDDQAGDNLYYLGFLFTLTSLGFSLWQFTATGATETIIENFGIALSTTIAGVAFRVIFNQMRQDPMEVERTARLELAESARKVRNELDSAALEFSHFRRSMQQSISDATAELSKNLNDLLSKANKGWDDLPSRSAEPLEKVSAQAAAALEKLNGTLISGLDSASQRLFSAIEGVTTRAESVSKELGQVSGKLSAIQIPKEITLGKIDSIGQVLSRAVEEIRNNNRNQSKIIQAAILSVQDASETALELADLARDARAFRSGEIDHAVGRIRQTLQNLAQYISVIGTQPTQNERQVVDALVNQEKHLEQIVSLLESRLSSRENSP